MDQKMMWCPKCAGMVPAAGNPIPTRLIVMLVLVMGVVDVGVMVWLIPASTILYIAIASAVLGAAFAAAVLSRAGRRTQYRCPVHKIALTAEHPPVSGTDFVSSGPQD